MTMLTLPTRSWEKVLLLEVAPKLSHNERLCKYLLYQDVTTVIVQVLGAQKAASELQQRR